MNGSACSTLGFSCWPNLDSLALDISHGCTFLSWDSGGSGATTPLSPGLSWPLSERACQALLGYTCRAVAWSLVSVVAHRTCRSTPWVPSSLEACGVTQPHLCFLSPAREASGRKCSPVDPHSPFRFFPGPQGCSFLLFSPKLLHSRVWIPNLGESGLLLFTAPPSCMKLVGSCFVCLLRQGITM